MASATPSSCFILVVFLMLCRPVVMESRLDEFCKFLGENKTPLANDIDCKTLAKDELLSIVNVLAKYKNKSKVNETAADQDEERVEIEKVLVQIVTKKLQNRLKDPNPKKTREAPDFVKRHLKSGQRHQSRNRAGVSSKGKNGSRKIVTTTGAPLAAAGKRSNTRRLHKLQKGTKEQSKVKVAPTTTPTTIIYMGRKRANSPKRVKVPGRKQNKQKTPGNGSLKKLDASKQNEVPTTTPTIVFAMGRKRANSHQRVKVPGRKQHKLNTVESDSSTEDGSEEVSQPPTYVSASALKKRATFRVSHIINQGIRRKDGKNVPFNMDTIGVGKNGRKYN
ncbi:uncharacterized protein LOC131950674 [Physella acuta]|uniref:uncharacterized protein LOC131950674 n=1 Tax=Physella acuta TaxID=109671 RepID=UPI0027DB2292|nr:uncharacterized protein LOC131950674 [Physella acuta]